MNVCSDSYSPINSVDCEFYFFVLTVFFPSGTLMVFPDWWIILHRIHSTPGSYPDNASVKVLQDPFEFYSFNPI